MKQNSSFPSLKFLILLCLVVTFCLSVLFATGFSFRRASTPASVYPIPTARAPETLSTSDSAKAVLAGFGAEKTDDPIHILLIGQDRRENESYARSDAIILCSFLPESEQLVLTSFLRDLYVEIPGHQPNRINAAYALGGMDLLRQTVESNFHVAVSGCIEVDFAQFAEAIDSLDGVTIQLRQDEADTINEAVPGDLAAGSQHLNGAQALAYSRIRSLDQDGDFSRTQRQRTVLTALLKRFQEANLRSLLNAAKEVLPVLTADMSQKNMLSLAMRIFPMLSGAGITSQKIPADGCFTYDTIRGMEVLVPDMDAARKLLEEKFQSDSTAFHEQ